VAALASFVCDTPSPLVAAKEKGKSRSGWLSKLSHPLRLLFFDSIFGFCHSIGKFSVQYNEIKKKEGKP